MKYYKIFLGRQNKYAELGIKEGIIGIDFSVPDLTQLDFESEGLRDDIKSIYKENRPDVTNASAGSAVGHIFRFIQTLSIGERVIVPQGAGKYMVGEIQSKYFYAGDNEPIPHRRKITWIGSINQEDFSDQMVNSFRYIGTISDVSNYSEEIEALLSGDNFKVEKAQNKIDQGEFSLEKHLEDFMIKNWSFTEFGHDYDLIIDEEGNSISQQYHTEVGDIDILAVKKDGSEILIIELKKGKSSDAVVGQTLRYRTAIKKEIAEDHQSIRAIIITGKDDKKVRYSLESLGDMIEFMVYNLSFSLKKIM